ncbi:hypothetical protein KEM52_005861 [Ascosphaera acerosa]|nr:hypothetical protein KEM52_005861 [Ascosphaera acerosa]
MADRGNPAAPRPERRAPRQQGGQQQQQQQQQEEQQGGLSWESIIQSVLLFLAVQWALGQFFGPKQRAATVGGVGADGQGRPLGGPVPAVVPPFEARPVDQDAIANKTAVPFNIAPTWSLGSALDIEIYLSSEQALPFFTGAAATTAIKVFDEKNFTLGDYDAQREASGSFAVPPAVQNNGTLYAHFLVALSGHQIDPSQEDYDTAVAYFFTRRLTEYLPKKRQAKLKNLLASEATAESGLAPEDEAAGEEQDASKGKQIASFYHANMTVSFVADSNVMTVRSLHPSIRNHIVLEKSGARDASGYHGWYYPILFLNKFWQLRSHMTELNSTVETLPFHITLTNQKNWKFSILATMDDSMKQAAAQQASGQSMTAGAGDGSEFEMIKEVLLDTNAYLLATTGIVSLLHMVFETLAFKNDISHWRQKKDRVGTSVRSILANVIMQLIVFLYLLDNSEGTSWMILFGQGFGVVLEAWKITKSVNVRLRRPAPSSRFSFLPYVVVFEDKHKLTEAEKKTKEYDEIAFKYLYIIAVPLLLAYAAYSLVYETHKGWYSFVIETLVGSVYAYGFLMMVPGLYINYRLKSVAHMPGRTLMYKFLNTFIDDLFAFTIKMPTLHRLATLRDDVIFFVWLYQSWKYKVDYTRVNEFGQGGESADEDEEQEQEEQVERPAQSEQQAATAAEASGRDGAQNGAGRKRK